MRLSTDGLRKAAILVASLDTAAADALLDQLAPDEARQVRGLVVELGNIDAGEQRRVIDEFFRAGPAAPVANPSRLVPPKNPPGIEMDSRAARVISDRARLQGPRRSEADRQDDRPFQFLQEAEAEKLARLLAAERPQTVALVLSHLPPERAGAVLSRLPGAAQAEVVRRLVDLEEADPEILREVEEALQSRLSEQVQMQRRRVAGLEAVAGILEATGRNAGSRILDNLSAHDPALAERLGQRPLEFDDLAALDDDLLAEVFDSAGCELLIPALVGASEELIGRMLGHLPADEADRIRRELNSPGPLRLSDVEEARREVARLARSAMYRRQTAGTA
ncbi:MAG: FliG C-terminal domain-containing protein [Thermoguttaceae bacterium]|jgi:flagellar motor switch protein FliG